MFCMIHIKVKVFLVPIHLIKKNMKWFSKVFCFFWCKISSTIVFCSCLVVSYVNKTIYMLCIHMFFEKYYVSIDFLWLLIFYYKKII
jgi:hypothetical protein